jgi:hypothetical protein
MKRLLHTCETPARATEFLQSINQLIPKDQWAKISESKYINDHAFSAEGCEVFAHSDLAWEYGKALYDKWVTKWQSEVQKCVGYVEAVVQFPIYENDKVEESQFPWFIYEEPGIKNGHLATCRRECKTISAKIIKT